MAFGKLKSVLSGTKSTSGSPTADEVPYSEPPLTPLHLHGYRSTTKHKLLTTEIAEELRSHLPSILQIGHEWQLLYSLEQNGASLNTLYSSVKPKNGENTNRRRGYLLVIEDSHRNVFGAYTNEHFKVLDGTLYYGNGDCFLWKIEHDKIKRFKRNSIQSGDDIKDGGNQIRVKVFPSTGLDNRYVYSTQSYISIGTGDGKFGLWMNDNLEKGASESVDTFGNEPLSDTTTFTIVSVEVWKV